MAFFSI